MQDGANVSLAATPASPSQQDPDDAALSPGAEVAGDVTTQRAQLGALQSALQASEKAAGEYRKQADANLWAIGRSASPFAENLPCIAFIKDSGGRYIYVNELWEKSFHKSFGQWYGKTDHELWPTEVADELVRNDRQVLESGHTVQAIEPVPAQEEPRFWLVTKFRLLDNSFSGVVGGVAVDVTDRKLAEQALQESERRYRELFDSAPAGLYRMQPDGRIVMANPALVRMLGYSSAAELGGVNPRLLFDAETRAAFRGRIEQEGQVQGHESTWLRKDGARIPVRETAKTVRPADGAQFYEGIVEDITALRRAEDLERRRNHVLELVARNAPLETILEELARLAEDQVPEMRCVIFLAREGELYAIAAPHLPAGLTARLQRGLRSRGMRKIRQCERTGEEALAEDAGFWAELKAAAGEHGLQACCAEPIVSNGERLAGALAMLQPQALDVCCEHDLLDKIRRLAALAIERRELYDQLAWQARYDRLTGLPNRSAFEAHLQNVLVQAAGDHGCAAVLWIDLDGFRKINDTLGHRIGDVLLQQAAARLAGRLTPEQMLARIGGDEFAVVLPGAGREAGARCASQILNELHAPFHVRGYELFVTASIGLCAYPDDGHDVATLQKNADTAMYHVKARGRNGYRAYDNQIRAGAEERLHLEHGLHRALERNEFELHYQPQTDLRRNVVGVESLVRWRHPTRGLLLPGQFIHIAEELGLIVALGAWVLAEACRQCVAWHGSGLPHLKVAVNVSPLQLYYSDFSDTVVRALERTGLPAGFLELELTESVFMHNLDEARRQIHKLRSLGVSVAIDDFGTGYSALSYLAKLPVNAIKIDRAFLEDIDSAPSRAVVRGISALAHGLRLEVIAEGIERNDQWNAMSKVGVDLVQGFLIARPMPAESAARTIRDLVRIS